MIVAMSLALALTVASLTLMSAWLPGMGSKDASASSIRFGDLRSDQVLRFESSFTDTHSNVNYRGAVVFTDLDSDTQMLWFGYEADALKFVDGLVPGACYTLPLDPTSQVSCPPER